MVRYRCGESKWTETERGCEAFDLLLMFVELQSLAGW